MAFHKLPNGDFGLLEWYPNLKKKAKPGTATAKDEPDATNPAEVHRIDTAPCEEEEEEEEEEAEDGSLSKSLGVLVD